MSPPPTPFHILRNHSASLSALSFNPENSFLYAGDQDGHVSITDLRSRRPVSFWQAHQGGVLSVEEWDGRLISHGRDNSLQIHEKTPRYGSLSSGPGPSRSAPAVDESLTTNSLNFCRFSLRPLSRPAEGGQKEALLAVPNLVDSELVDVYLLPSRRRLHASINYTPRPKVPVDEMSIKPDAGRTGLVMGIHLDFDQQGRLSCVMGFEDGRIEVWQCGSPTNYAAQPSHPSSSKLEPEEWRRTWDARMSTGPRLWEKVYEAKGHNEAVMAMAVDRQMKRSFTVSADHLVVRYDLSALTDPSAPLQLVRADQVPEGVKSFSTGSIGNASIAVSHDGAVVAVGGWDGKIRLFSASSLKPLGVLAYHRDTVHSLAFASPPLSANDAAVDSASTVEIGGDDDEDSDDEAGAGGSEARDRWLASGGKDNRIALWALKDFTR